MDNRGKIWSIDDDQRLMESPHLSNAFFSQSMGRSENAIKMRRSHLAAKMHQNDPNTPLEEYVGLMGGDLDHAAQLLQEWSEKRASLKSFLESASRKRKAQQQREDPPSPSSRFFPQTRQTQYVEPSTAWLAQPPEKRIAAVCRSIREEGGNLASCFNDPDFVPVLIQHYPGFEAYARVVQAQARPM